jgi:hypothetical protein
MQKYNGMNQSLIIICPVLIWVVGP